MNIYKYIRHVLYHGSVQKTSFAKRQDKTRKKEKKTKKAS